MALSGIQIYKMLPQTNCKECGFPTCLAFAMKLAAKQVELSTCPYVSEASKAQLAESSAPPIRLVTLKGIGTEVKVGNEVCLFRHEKTFYNKTGLFVRVKSSQSDIAATVAKAEAFKVGYVGMDFSVDGFAVEADEPSKFADAVKAVRSASKRPLILISKDPAVLSAGLASLAGETPLLVGADASNWEALADLAKTSKAALAVSADSLEELAALTEKIKAKGVDDLVLIPGGKTMGESLAKSTQIRRLALKNFRALGFPILTFPGDAGSAMRESLFAAQAVTKYA
ncbi:MAG: acetyl-CoA decarbonylase/synthase complex subunit gamma, partial [Chloroflexi bacterium]|nr:acetyl-CoA decarbonylase/synthase complex subunit gamma [Chloroflexota bacterium]